MPGILQTTTHAELAHLSVPRAREVNAEWKTTVSASLFFPLFPSFHCKGPVESVTANKPSVKEWKESLCGFPGLKAWSLLSYLFTRGEGGCEGYFAVTF